jgi:anti-sigma-K factor RskA
MDLPADVHTLSGAYAAGAVDDLDRALFERHLDACPGCRDEVRGLRETLVRLAGPAAVVPADVVRRTVMGQIRTTVQVRPRAVAADVPVARDAVRRPRARAPWLVAAACAVLAVGGGSFARAQHHAAEGERRLSAVVTDPEARRVSGRASGGGTVALVLANGRAAVLTADLPGLPVGRTYQLWRVRPGEISPEGLGPAEAAAAGSWSRLVDGVAAGDVVAISVEPVGGSPQPSTTPIVALRA